MTPLIQDFTTLFEGYSEAYGIYNITVLGDGSKKIKGNAASIKGQVTTELWEKHLAGEQGLGIIPINENSCVKFAAIDIDVYPLNHFELNNKISRLNLPLTLTRSKSGGAHLWIFLNDWTPVDIVVSRLRQFAAMLGHGNADTYPKQTKILVERGDVGQWINVPYFDGDKTTRYAYSINNTKLTAAMFVELAKSRIVTKEELESFQAEVKTSLDGGPPCLQHIVTQGFPEGTRNNGLFNLGVYAVKAFPDSWETMISKYNTQYMDPPLGPSEVAAVVKSLKKKEYFYTCNTQPMLSYCNKAVCRTCKFGVGDGDLGLPTLGSLTKILTTPPIWFITVEGGGRIQLDTEDLQNPAKFQTRCMDELNIMPGIPKRDLWTNIVKKLFENVTIVQVPADSSPKDLFMTLLGDFLTSRVQASKAEEILLGKPWLSGEYYLFRLRDFMLYLDRQKFYEFRQHKIIHLLTESAKAKGKFLNLRGKGVNVFMVPSALFTAQSDSFETPEIKGPEQY